MSRKTKAMQDPIDAGEGRKMTDAELMRLVKSIAGDLQYGSSRLPVDVSTKVFLATLHPGDRVVVHLWEELPSPVVTPRKLASALTGLAVTMREVERPIVGAVLVHTFDGYIFVIGKTPAGSMAKAWAPLGELLPGERATIGRFTFADITVEPMDDGEPLNVLFAAGRMKEEVFVAFVDRAEALAGEIMPEGFSVTMKRYTIKDWGQP